MNPVREMNNEPLVLDLLEWLACSPRTYGDVMRAWRTTCPKLTIWEDAVDAGFVRLNGASVLVTQRGTDLLRAHARPAASASLPR